jgi:outer membrane murein-binding lipoprotein Lpp
MGAVALASLLLAACGNPDEDLQAEVEQLQTELASRDADQVELLERVGHVVSEELRQAASGDIHLPDKPYRNDLLHALGDDVVPRQ